MTATSDVLRADLRSVYLAAFDQFAVNIGDVADLPNVGNYRYARELIGVLMNQGLIAETDVNGEDTVYQTTPDTYDNIDRDEAERRIDDLLNRMIPASATTIKKERKMSTKTADTKTATPTEFRHCGCGCGENVAGKSMYRPGHDARHAGKVAREAFAQHADGDEGGFNASILSLPTEALQAKARAMVTGWIEKNNAKAARAAAKTEAKKAATPVEPEYTEGTMKKGRWEYPTRIYQGGVVDINTRRDGSGEWVPVD